jgi:hypothetical protein
LSYDGNGNARIKTSAGDFINPTEFRCLANSYFKQSANSKVFVENSAKYEVNANAELVINHLYFYI